MKGRFAIVLLAVFCLGGASQASEGPRFGASGPLDLPDGRRVEMRLLYGERFMTAARGRVVVIDENGRILAKSRSSRPMSLVCTNTTCSGYDHATDKILEADPDSFRPEPIVSGRQSPDLYIIEEGEGHWGFKERTATLRDQLLAEIALAKEKSIGFILVGAVGAMTALLAAGSVAICSSRKTNAVMVLAEVFLVLFSAVGILILILLSLYIGAVVAGLSVTTWLVSIASGALSGVAMAVAIRTVVRLIRRKVSI